MPFRLWGVPDIFSQDFCTISTNSPSLIPADMPLSNLKTEEPSEISRINTQSPERSKWIVSFAGLNVSIDGIALINHNLVAGDYVRFVFGNQLPDVTTQAANAIAASDNMAAGAVTDVDEGVDSPDGVVLGPSSLLTAWFVRFSWGALSATPKTGTAMGQFGIVVRRVFTAGGTFANATTLPFIKAELYENGSLKTLLGHRAISIDAGTTEMFIFPFDFADLAQPGGADLEFKLTFYPGFGASGGSYGTLDSLLLFFESTATIPTNDSGYIRIPEQGTIDAPTKSIHYAPPATWTDTFQGTIFVLSDGAEKDPLKYSSTFVAVGHITRIPDTFIQAGKLCGGEFLGSSINVLPPGPQVAVHTEEISGRTIGGQSYGANSYQYRYASDVKLTAPRDEKDKLLDLLNWRKGLNGAFYIAFESDVSLERQLFSSFYATLTQDIPPPTLVTGRQADASIDLYNISLSVEEKL